LTLRAATSTLPEERFFNLSPSVFSITMPTRTLQITVNGRSRELPNGTTVAGLLEQLGLQPRYVAVERNRTLVPRGEHAGCVLHAGDELEIVTLVGGG